MNDQETATSTESEAPQIGARLPLVEVAPIEQAASETAPEVAPDKGEAKTPEEEAPKPLARVADAESIIAAFNPKSGPTVIPREIEVANKIVVFGVRLPSYSEASQLDAKRYRKRPNGQPFFDMEYAETVGMGYQLAALIMRDTNVGKVDGEGKPLAPDWVKMFTPTQVLGTGKGDGLMDSDAPEATELVYGLTQAIWNEVPTLNPLATSAAMEQMGLQRGA